MITVLIPFFGGTSTATNSAAGNRGRYLQRTLETVRPISASIVIGVCNDQDARIHPNTLRLACPPEHLASALCRWGQRHVTSSHVYVTEADQALHFDPRVLGLADETHYLVPHRLEQVHEHPTGTLLGSDRGACVKYNGKLWVLPNGQPPDGWGGGSSYEPEDRIDAFGGAFFAATGLFRQVDFADSEEYPVEHATGFRIHEAGTCLKTRMWRWFFVEHLSGIEYHRSLLIEEPETLVA